MSKINLALADGEVVVTGKQVTFKAPCSCSEITSLVLGGKEYDLVASNGASLANTSNVFSAGSLVSVLLNTEESKAYIMNSAISTAVKTINGDSLAFFVGTTDEYNALTDAQKKNLFALITDDKSKEEIENAIIGLREALETFEQNLTSGKTKVGSASYAASAGNAWALSCEPRILSEAFTSPGHGWELQEGVYIVSWQYEYYPGKFESHTAMAYIAYGVPANLDWYDSYSDLHHNFTLWYNRAEATHKAANGTLTTDTIRKLTVWHIR